MFKYVEQRDIIASMRIPLTDSLRDWMAEAYSSSPHNSFRELERACDGKLSFATWSNVLRGGVKSLSGSTAAIVAETFSTTPEHMLDIAARRDYSDAQTIPNTTAFRNRLSQWAEWNDDKASIDRWNAIISGETSTISRSELNEISRITDLDVDHLIRISMSTDEDQHAEENASAQKVWKWLKENPARPALLKSLGYTDTLPVEEDILKDMMRPSPDVDMSGSFIEDEETGIIEFPVPFRGSIAAGEPGGHEEKGTVMAPRELAGDNYAIRVNGPSMEPGIPDGALIEVKPLKSRGGYPAQNTVVVYSDGGGSSLKRFKYRKAREGEESNQFGRVAILTSDNPDFPEVSPIEGGEIQAVFVGVIEE